jgi:hypothetical protein
LNDDEALFDSGFDDTGPFRVSPESGGVSLETALRDFGPAAIEDLIPRIRAIARRLDVAHRAGFIHGALHPSTIFVAEAATSVIAGTGARVPYAAPEVIDGHGATPFSDQYSLAAIAYEWLFGRPVAPAGERPIEVRAMPGVDRPALSKAFTRALAPKPADRFASCGAFCDAFAGAVVPELPLLAGSDTDADADADADAGTVTDATAADVDDFAPEDETASPPIGTDDLAAAPAFSVDPPRIVDDEPVLHAAPLDEISPVQESRPVAAVPAWDPPFARSSPPVEDSPRFGPFALIFAVIVGAVFGFAAGYMARPRALQSEAQTIATAPEQGASGASGAATGAAPTTEAPAPKALQAPQAPQAPQSPQATEIPKVPARPGRLLVRSSPSGASVTVDGVARGETPLALRDLDVGTRSVTISRSGYVAETRKVSITKERPARTLDVRMTAETAAAATPRPSTPATIGKPAATTGTLVVESRPAGAAVTINGKPSGTTPLTINDLAPGEYRVVMTLPGYRDFTSTVQVVAGERVRAAASLTALEQQ